VTSARARERYERHREEHRQEMERLGVPDWCVDEPWRRVNLSYGRLIETRWRSPREPTERQERALRLYVLRDLTAQVLDLPPEEMLVVLEVVLGVEQARIHSRT
jgi:hypothetical protein